MPRPWRSWRQANLRKRTASLPWGLSMGSGSLKIEMTAMGVVEEDEKAPKCEPMSSSGSRVAEMGRFGQSTAWRRGNVSSSEILRIARSVGPSGCAVVSGAADDASAGDEASIDE